MTIEVPASLIEEARRGRVVLLLGAGASIGSTAADGRAPLTGNGLRDALSDRFLGGRHKSGSLSWVAELAISESDLGSVQDYIAELFRDLRPAAFHKKLATFRWRGIATTNYDTLVEEIYRTASRVQELVPIRSDNDRMEQLLRTDKDLALLKLHGCITRTRDPQTAFILTTDQYITHRRGRMQLFTTLREWGSEFPIVFVGHAGQDSDIRELLLELSQEQDFRPRYYLLKPDAEDAERRLWDAKRISIIDGTFEQLLDSLDIAIDATTRPLLREIVYEHAIHRLFVVDERVSSLLADYLSFDLEYLHESIGVAGGNPQDFYRGFDFGWYPIVARLDVRRNLTQKLLNDVIVRAEGDRPSIAELYVVAAEAGAGKSIFLRRLAWEAATQADVLCLNLREDGVLKYEALREIHRVTKQRLFVFVDSASKHAQEIAHAISSAIRERLPLTIFTAERQNVWNVTCERLVPLVTEILPLRYLSHEEIKDLVNLLSTHHSLGPHLSGKTKEQCVEEFEERAGRQLLVALHEATVGLPFEEILLNEYSQIVPRSAQQLYLTVCVMNRLKVGVRAGLISRVHGISFDEFESKLFAPLEHVVQVRQYSGTQDYVYAARHPEIAQIIFDRVLDRPADRYNEYARIFAHLNLAYGSDRLAFRGLIRARALLDLFPNHDDIVAIFVKALEVGPREAYVYQQYANYERIRANGNSVHAESLLETARELDPRDLSIVHSLAELKRTRAERARHALEREKFRNDARALLDPLLSDQQHGRYARVTMVKLALDELRDVLARADAGDKEVDQAIRFAQTHLERAQQQYPDEQFLHTAESDFGHLLLDDERSFRALGRAFSANPRDPFIASRFARLQEDQGDLAAAEEILATALNANRGDKQLNFQYANVLRRSRRGDAETLTYHYRRSYSKWDTNYEAQFWFARFAFESTKDNEREESKIVFRHLREVPLAHETRVLVRDQIANSDGPVKFYGRLTKVEYSYGFVEREGAADHIFCHSNSAEDWETFRLNERVQFNVGFSFSGAVALHVSRS